MATTLGICRYYGGKNPHVKADLVAAITGVMPRTPVYAEPFSGMASIFLHKAPRSRKNILNDADGRISNLLRVIREHPRTFARMIRFTPSKSRRDFFRAVPQDHPDPIIRAWQTYVVLRMSIANNTAAKTIAIDTADMSLPCGRVEAAKIEQVGQIFCDSGVLLENVDAIELIRKLSGKENAEDVLIYADPPYLPSTRTTGTVYAHEMSVEQHQDFLAAARASRCKMVVSGYRSDLYDLALADWHRQDVQIQCRITSHKFGQAAGHRTESIWTNYPPETGGQSELAV